MFQACLVKVVIHATIDYHQRIKDSNKMFSISVSFGEHNMLFAPSLDKFLDMLTNLWRGTIQVVNAVPSFLSVRAYEQYVTVQNHQTVESILNCNRDFQNCTAAIRGKIESDIMSAQRVSDNSFAIFRRIYEYGEAWNEEEYIAKSHSHDELARDMTAMREFQDDLEKFKSHHNVGIIVVDGKNLRESLRPIPERSLDKMKEALTEIARKKSKTVLARFEEANKSLDERPPGLGKFADYVKEYNKICDVRDDMANAQEEVDSMYQLLKQYNVRVKTDDSHHLDVLQNASLDFMHKKTVEAHSYIQEKRDEMCETLQSVSNRIEDEAKEVVDLLNRGQFVAEDAILSPSLVLEELKQVEQTLDRLKERALTYTEYQGLFQMPSTIEFMEVEKAKLMFANKHKLWTLVSEWQDDKRRWSNDSFFSLDVEKMNKTVLEHSKNAFILSKALDGDEVAQKIRQFIDDWKVNMPTIMELGNPAMQKRHMDKIKQTIAMGTTTPPTLHSLTYHNIFHYKDLVSEISGIASGEYALEQQLEKIKAAWKDLLMPTMNHRNQRNLWILADVTDIITLLEDHSVQIQTMMGSRFVTEIRKNVEVALVLVCLLACFILSLLLLEAAIR
jgi:dynein heavy chain